MSAIISFFTVCSAIVILVPLALGMQLVAFLHEYLLEVSIVIWSLVLLFSFFTGRKEKDTHDRWFIYTCGFCMFPVYCFLAGAVQDIMAMRGFEVVLAVLIELPLCTMVSLGGGIGIGLLAEKIEEPAGEATVMILGNVMFAVLICSFGI